MRLWVLAVVVVLVLGGSLPGLAQQQQQTETRTLETLLEEDGETPSRRPSAVDASTPAAVTPLPSGRIQGAVARPKDGVQHPDLDTAWAEYDGQIEAAAQAVQQAIEREFDKAAEAGDLDATLKWKTAGEQFKKDGRIPKELDGQRPQGRPKPKPTKPDASSQSLVAEARGRLAKAYEAVEKELVKSLDLEKAKQVRSEWASVSLVSAVPTLSDRLRKHRYLKVIISPQGQRQELTEMHEFYGQGEIRVNGKPVSMKWQPIGEDGIRLEIGKPHGHVVLRMNADDSLVGRNEGRSDGAVWGWELLPQGVAVANQDTELLAGRWAAGPDDPYVRVIEPQGRVREFDRRTGKETAAGALRRLDDGRYEAVMSNGFTVYWQLLAGDRAEFHVMDRAGKMQDKVVLKKQ